MSNFLKKVGAFFKTIAQIVTKSVPKELKDYSEKSLEITYGLKKFLEGYTGDIITSIIPGTWDDNLRKQMLQYINETLPYLILVNECKDKGDVGEMLKCWVDKLQAMPKHTRDAMLIKFAALLTRMQDNGQLKQSQYDYAVQAIYTADIKKGNFETKYASELKED